MSVFDYPRINVQGTIRLNPGTANNDDYAGAVTFPEDWGAFAGETLALIDSKRVEARTYGMSDENFIAWAQKAQPFKGSPPQVIPAEWNYYGDMSSQDVEITVVGVQTGPCDIHSEAAADVPLTDCLGAQLTFYGSITDINSEGSPPATQFFIEQMTLQKGGSTLISGKLSKGVGQWLNFYRNVNLVADAGAGSYVYQAFPDAEVQMPGWESLNARGVIFRYYLYRPLLENPEGGSNAGIEKIYQNPDPKDRTNPKILQLVGTFAPLLGQEKIVAAPTGRLLASDTVNLPTPKAYSNNGSNGWIALAPGVVHRNGDILSADFSGTFPDNYQEKDNTNPKYDFGPVSLVVVSGSKSAEVGAVNYADTAKGDQRGWLFDFDISSNPDAQQLLKDPQAALSLTHPLYGELLAEVDYYFVSNQQAVYAEQFGSASSFLNNGTQEPATVSVFRRGQELTADSCPPITVWQYRSVPMQAPGDAEPISTSFEPGQALTVDTAEPGNFLFTFTINDSTDPPPQGYPPKSYANFMNPPYVTNAPQISLRILPNDMSSFSRYFVDPSADEPVGNERLTFEVVYEKVLRTYYLLYPAMNLVFPLNSEKAVAQNAQAILERTDPSIWMSVNYMPRTRDLSSSRRTLLQAWCRKILKG
ncbi:MAG TPA: hypothetical protein VLU25_08260 [Acidobacteriota bacterium]|nr:hypothetical protein [Acidobacteriota bacterium]